MNVFLKAGALALSAALALAAPVRAETTLIVAGSEATGSLLERMAQKFTELVTEKSDGSVDVKLILGQSLGNAQQVMEQHQAGSVDMMFTRPDWFTTNVPDFQVMNWGFTFRDADHLNTFLASPVFAEMSQQVVDKMGLRVLAAGADQPRILFSRTPIHKVEDIQGLKMRVPGIKAYLALWSELGAVPTQIAWAEAFLALQTGGVEAAEADASGAYSQKFNIAAPNIARTDHVISSAIFTINDAKWQTIPPEDQAIIQEAAKEAVAWMSQEAQKDSEATLAKMVEEGATINEVDKAEFAEKASAGVAKMEAEGIWSPGLWQRIHDL